MAYCRRDGQNKDDARNLLEMALQTKIRVPHGQHFGIDAAVRVVTGGAAFAHGFVPEHVRTALGRVTLQAAIIL